MNYLGKGIEYACADWQKASEPGVLWGSLQSNLSEMS